MKNFVFISPNFPVNYWQFCRQLRNNGLRVLGIGDQPYDTLLPELKSALHEYYKVGSMENYDEVYRAVAFFISNTAVSTGWRATTNTGWSTMPCSVPISTSPAASKSAICRASSSSPR